MTISATPSIVSRNKTTVPPNAKADGYGDTSVDYKELVENVKKIVKSVKTDKPDEAKSSDDKSLKGQGLFQLLDSTGICDFGLLHIAKEHGQGILSLIA